MQSVAVGWEYEVPLEEVLAAREHDRAQLEGFYHAAVESLTDCDVARYILRAAHPTSRYLRPEVGDLGFSRHHA